MGLQEYAIDDGRRLVALAILYSMTIHVMLLLVLRSGRFFMAS
jgi:hypothetical protein